MRAEIMCSAMVSLFFNGMTSKIVAQIRVIMKTIEKS